MYHYFDVLLLVLKLYIYLFAIVHFYVKNCFIYHSCSTHHILNVLANTKNINYIKFCIILSLLDDFSTNSFMADLIHNLSVRSHSFTFYCKRKEKQISR